MARHNPRNLRSSLLQGTDYVRDLLNEMARDIRRREVTGMSRELFSRFVRAVETGTGIRNGTNVALHESCTIFLAIMHQRLSNRQAQESFQNSGSTITLWFRHILGTLNVMRTAFSKCKYYIPRSQSKHHYASTTHKILKVVCL